MTVRSLCIKQIKKHIISLIIVFMSIFSTVFLVASLGLCFFYCLNNGFMNITPIQIVSIVGAIFIVTFVSVFYQNYGISSFSNNLIKDIREILINYFIVHDTEQNNPSTFLVFDIQKFHELLDKNVIVFIRHILMIITASIMVIWVSSLLFFVSILLLPGIFIQHFYMSKQSKLSYEHQNIYLNRFSGILYDIFDKIRTIQLFDQCDKIIIDCKNKIADIIDYNRISAFRASFSLASYVILFLTILSGIVFLGADLITKEYISVGSLTAFLYLLFLIFISLYTLGQKVSDFNEMSVLIDKINQTLSQISIKTNEDQGKKKLKIYPAKGFIALHNLCFAYPKVNNHMVLDDINLSIYPGQTVIIVGPPGAGKTTLLNLILRFYKPKKGNIYLDGVNIHDLSLKDLRSQVTMVEQEPILFSTSICENIRFGNPSISDDEITRLLDVLMPKQFYKKLPQGIYTIIGQEGYGLSVGQKQCIVLARALVRNPSVLLLDEAMSGLDSDSERHINKSLLPIIKDRTTIMVTHRLANISIADQIILMDSGRIIAHGNHETLYAQNLFYRKLIKAESQQFYSLNNFNNNAL